MIISIDDIKNLVVGKVFNRGVRYFKDDRVRLTQVESEKFSAEVFGSEIYFVEVSQVDGRFHTSCTCPYWFTCKHVVAALLAAMEYYRTHGAELARRKHEPRWKTFFDKLVLEERETPRHSISAQSWKIIYTIEFKEKCWILTPQKLHLKKDGSFGRFNAISSFDRNNIAIQYAPNDPIIIYYLQSVPSKYYLADRLNYSYRDYYYAYNEKVMDYGENVGMILDLMKDSSVYLLNHGELVREMQFLSSPARIQFHFEQEGQDFVLKPYIIWNETYEIIDSRFRVMTEKPIWLVRDNQLIKLENCESARLLLSFTTQDFQVKIPQKELPQFIDNTLGKLLPYGEFKFPDSYPIQPIPQITGKRLYLNEGEKHLQVFLKALYNQIEVDVNSPETNIVRMREDQSAILQVTRDFAGEQSMIQRVLESGLKEHKDGYLQIIDSRAMRWIFEQIPELVHQGFEIFGREQLKKYKFNTARPRINFSVNSQIDWFDLNVEIDFDGIALSLKELRKAFQKKTPYVQLVDGSLAILPDDWLVKFEHLFNFGKVEEKQVRLSKYHLTLIDLLLERANRVQTDEPYQQRSQRLKNFEKIESKEAPKNFKGMLRAYQKTGYDWLYFLKDYSFGGCLADDMGLGKTIQALALLLNEKNQSTTEPSLIICPKTVIFNWENEIQKFAPGLRVLNHTGVGRLKDDSAFEYYDIILTSYSILLRDIQFLADYHFHYIILDESQKMKNPLSLTAKSIRLLQCNHRLALTGTPVENNTIELWSLFSFLNPGLLGSSSYFKKAFTLQIDRKKNEDTAEQLRRIIFPFILRRTKDQVAKELPPKVEQISYCHMNEQQNELYHHWRNYYRAVILQQIDEVGLNKSRMRVLEGLTKLRLIACHPKMIDKDVQEDSGKFELLQEVLEEITSENHKVLVFSQFVKMLTIVRNYLDRQKIPYEYLDGRTRDREACIQRFQTDNTQIFLISLKAGGTGVNLTAADYVIHYDPWWNPAVEVQATDRTHRIGQNKKVFVYRFITKDTVEEKILQLQEQKLQLVSQLITTDSSMWKSISREDIEILFG